MSFADLKTNHAIAVLAQRGESGQFAESAAWKAWVDADRLPAGNDPRRLLVASVEADQDSELDNQDRSDVERIRVFFLRDESNATYGGVEFPKVGDLFFRSAAMDNNNAEPFYFVGEVESDSGVITFVGRFERAYRENQGAQ